MSFNRGGIREICDITFRPLQATDFGKWHFEKMQPCLLMDTAQTSSLESSSSTVYAQGGKGNPRLIAWDGEKTMTLNITDALISPISFAMLSGAGITEGAALDEDEDKKLVHITHDGLVQKEGETLYVEIEEPVAADTDVYAYRLDSAGAVDHYFAGTQKYVAAVAATDDAGAKKARIVLADMADDFDGTDVVVSKGDLVRVDYYTLKENQLIEITPEDFAGYYYIEAEGLWRNEADGVDYPAIITIPRGKIQTNFTLSMSASGDPSTFEFVIDAMPGYTKFNGEKKVLAAVQIVDASGSAHPYDNANVHGHEAFEEADGKWSTIYDDNTNTDWFENRVANGD